MTSGWLQVTTKLKPGKMWDHEGTYMGGIGFKYRGHVVVCEVTDDSELRRALRPNSSLRINGHWSCRQEPLIRRKGVGGWQRLTGSTLCSFSQLCQL